MTITVTMITKSWLRRNGHRVPQSPSKRISRVTRPMWWRREGRGSTRRNGMAHMMISNGVEGSLFCENAGSCWPWGRHPGIRIPFSTSRIRFRLEPGFNIMLDDKKNISFPETTHSVLSRAFQPAPRTGTCLWRCRILPKTLHPHTTGNNAKYELGWYLWRKNAGSSMTAQLCLNTLLTWGIVGQAE